MAYTQREIKISFYAWLFHLQKQLMLLWLHPWQYILYDIKMSINMAEIITQTDTHSFLSSPVSLFCNFSDSAIIQLSVCIFSLGLGHMPFLSFPFTFVVFFSSLLKSNMRKITRQKGNATEERQHKLLRALGRKNMVESIVEIERNSSECCSSCRPLGQGGGVAG